MTKKRPDSRKPKVKIQPDESTSLLRGADPTNDLRRRAEEIYRRATTRNPKNLDGISLEETQSLFHELQVHQIELEMQNEELRRAHTELENTLTKYSDLYDFAPVGYCTLDEQGLILEANLTGATLLGVVKSVLMKQPLTRYILPEDQDIYYVQHKRLLDTPSRQVCELRMFRVDAAPFWARLEATSMKDGKGEYLCRIVISDITKHKQVENALGESEKLYHSLFEHMLNGLAYCRMHFDDKGRPHDFTYLSVNNAFETLTGLRNVAGKKVTEVIPGIRDSDQELFAIYGRVSKTGKPERFEIFVDTLKMWFLVSAYSPERGYFVALFDVITKRKQAERTLQDAHDELEQRVAIRTKELQQSEENFRRSKDESPLGVRIVTSEGETIYANQAVLDIYGYDSLEELETTPVKRRYTPESYAAFLNRRKQRRQGIDDPSEYALSIIRKNGEVRHLQVFRKEVLWNGKKLQQVIYNDITRRKQAEEALATESKHLEQTNTALRVLLSHQQSNLAQTEQKMVANLQKLVVPYIGQLRRLHLSPSQSNYLDIIDSNLQQVISPFLQNLTARFAVLTPREIQVATLIKEGKTSKEIAEFIKTATRSVESHRNSIRKKLKLDGKKTNLRSFLITLS